MQQLNFFNVKIVQKQQHNTISTHFKNNKIKENIKKWNTIKHIYRYQTFYKICEYLFLLTYQHKLACLDYYIEEEIDNNKTYTIMYAYMESTANYPLKERILAHIDLIRRIKSKDTTLEYDFKKVDSEILTLFG